MPSVISVIETLIPSPDIVVVEAISLSVSGPNVVVGIDIEVVVDLVVEISDSLGSFRSDANVSTARVVGCNKGTLVWVEVEMIENFRALGCVVNTGNLGRSVSTSGLSSSRELRGSVPNTERRGGTPGGEVTAAT